MKASPLSELMPIAAGHGGGVSEREMRIMNVRIICVDRLLSCLLPCGLH